MAYGQKIDAAMIHEFVESLALPEVARQELIDLTPARYIANALVQDERI